MTSKDKLIWEAYTKTLHPVAKKKRKQVAAKPVPEKIDLRKFAEKGSLRLSPHLSPDAVKKPALLTLERRREKALRQGELAIEAKLDLHGMTQNEALEALGCFLPRSIKAGKRHLLIITGKGSDGNGVLRRNLEGWLRHSQEAKSILTIRTAALKHGGAGAFYVLLRKK